MVQRRLGEVDEFQRALRFDDAVPLAGLDDVRDVVQRAGPRGAVIDGPDLVRVQRFVSAGRRMRGYVMARRLKYPNLWDILGQVDPLKTVEERIGETVDDEGRVRDSASPALRRIRRDLVNQQQALRKAVTDALRRAVSEGYSPEDNPTLRNGRMVIPVRAEAKRKVQGFVHDTSATGHTVYIEPASCLELNNEVRSLELEEQREILRILQAVTDCIRDHAGQLGQNSAALGRIDLIQAKARLANRLDAQPPTISEQPVVRIRRGRNPALALLALESTESGGGGPRTVIPLDLELGIDGHVLVITGPNAGGKSVAMKTVGLFALMLAYGLPVPAETGSEVGLFDALLVDLGDEQSIADDLSTFGAHVAAQRHILDRATGRSLVLIDEAGTGTDPAEGSALAQAVLEELAKRGTRVVATTHHGSLKVFAHQFPGVSNASLEFDRDSLRPTYQFQAGLPGASYAFDVAARLGLHPDVLERARDLAGTGRISFEQLLAELSERSRRSAEHEERLHKELEALERERERQEESRIRWEDERDLLKGQALAEAERVVREANARVERTIREIKEAGAERDATRKAREDLDAFRKEVETGASAIRKRSRSRPRSSARHRVAATESSKAIQVGDRVRVDDGELEAEVAEIEGAHAVVVRGSFRARVTLERLTRVGGARAQQVVVKTLKGIGDSPSLRAATTIDVRGKRVDEVLPLITRFVDDGVAARLDRLEILHGTGTGALRHAIREALLANPDVDSCSDAPWELGGPGVTLVTLK